MNIKKEIRYLIFEIILCVFIILFGFYLWNNFDMESFLIAKSYENKEGIILDITDTDNIVLSNNEDIIEPNILYLHNISGNNNTSKLIVKINKNNELFKNNTILKIDDNYYVLNDLDYYNDKDYTYIILDEFTFDGYETKELSVKLLTKDKVNTDIYTYLNYEFITEI